MKRARHSIAGLMIIVGIVGLNLASTQLWSHSSHPSLLTGRSLTTIALQVGLFGAIRGRRSRTFTFWIGFEGFGSAAAIASIYIDFFSRDDSRLFYINDLYLANIYNLLYKICKMINDPYYRGLAVAKLSSHDGGLADNLLFELVSSLPQLFTALIGGLFMAALCKMAVRLNAVSAPIGD